MEKHAQVIAQKVELIPDHEKTILQNASVKLLYANSALIRNALNDTNMT
jgi:hypothetical protein